MNATMLLPPRAALGSFALAAGSVLSLLMPAGPAAAQTPAATTITREESPLRADLPGLAAQRRERYAMSGTNWGTVYFMSLAAPAGNYPRAEVRLAKGHMNNWVDSKKLDADVVKRSSPFLRDKQISETSAVKLSQSDTRHFFTFTTETANCLAFDVIPDLYQERNRMGTMGGNVGVAGYYCGPPGAPLTETDVQWVLWGLQVALPPGGPVMRLAAAQPATPPSAAAFRSQASAAGETTDERPAGGGGTGRRGAGGGQRR